MPNTLAIRDIQILILHTESQVSCASQNVQYLLPVDLVELGQPNMKVSSIVTAVHFIMGK
jgi:hypothetical protein